MQVKETSADAMGSPKTRDWEIEITVFHIKKLRELPEPIKLTDPDALANVLEDEVAQYETIWALVENQAKTFGVNAEAFAKIFTKNYVAFAEALVGALTNFFRDHNRTDLSKLIEGTLRASKKLRALADKNLSSGLMDEIADNLVAERQLEVDKLIATVRKTTTKSSGDSPESSE